MVALWGEIAFIPTDFYHLIMDYFVFSSHTVFIYTDLT